MLTTSLNMDAPAELASRLRKDSGADAPEPGHRRDRSRPFRSHLAILGGVCAGPFLASASVTALFASGVSPAFDPATFLLPPAAAAALATLGFSSVTKRLLRACGALGDTTAALASGENVQRRMTAVHEVNVIIDTMTGALGRDSRRGDYFFSQERSDKRLEGTIRSAREEALALAAATPDVVFVTDRHGKIVEANDRVEHVFGQSAAGVVGLPLEAVLPNLCGGVGELAWDIETVLDMPPGATIKFEGLASDGRALALEGYSAGWRTSDGHPRFSLVLRDVTAERRRYEKLLHSKESTRRETVDKTRFLVAMSDEVREPLNAVVGLADLLLEEKGLDEEVRLRIGMMRSAGASLLDVVSDAIDLSRLDTGTLKLDAKPFSARAVLEQCVAAARAMTPPRDLSLTCVVDPLVPAFVYGDAARFRQIASNMIVNVMRVRRRGEAHVSLAPSERDGWLRLNVTECGPGPSEGTLDDMLHDLGPLDDVVARRLGGARMAMTIARRLTDLMDGRIGVSSRGTTSSAYYFEASFPACAPAVSQNPQPAPAKGSQPLRVLVVDDVATNREIAVAVLQAAKHQVDAAGGAQEAIEAVRAKPYDVILMDVEMPDFDGLMATRAIRSLTGGSGRTPILALTAGVYADQRAACLAAGMDDHIGKPVNFEELREKVSTWAARGAARAAEPVASPSGSLDLRHVPNAFGRPRALRLLDAFGERLEQPLSDVDDLELVRAEAHKLVAESGMLGFRDLSRASQDLEQACGSSDPELIAHSVKSLLAEAAAARAAIASLMR